MSPSISPLCSRQQLRRRSAIMYREVFDPAGLSKGWYGRGETANALANTVPSAALQSLEMRETSASLLPWNISSRRRWTSCSATVLLARGASEGGAHLLNRSPRFRRRRAISTANHPSPAEPAGFRVTESVSWGILRAATAALCCGTGGRTSKIRAVDPEPPLRYKLHNRAVERNRWRVNARRNCRVRPSQRGRLQALTTWGALAAGGMARWNTLSCVPQRGQSLSRASASSLETKCSEPVFFLAPITNPSGSIVVGHSLRLGTAHVRLKSNLLS